MFKLDQQALDHARDMAATLWETDTPSTQQVNEIVLNACEGRHDRNEYEELIGDYEITDLSAYNDLKDEMGL